VLDVVDTQLPERIDAGDVGLDDMGDPRRVGLNHAFGVVHTEHVEPEAHELGRDGTPETAETEHDDGFAGLGPCRRLMLGEGPFSRRSFSQ
jgi:hypothetical protein